MSTTAASGLLAVVCALLQGNPLQMQLRVDGDKACLLRDGKPTFCARLPSSLVKVDPQAGHG